MYDRIRISLGFVSLFLAACQGGIQSTATTVPAITTPTAITPTITAVAPTTSPITTLSTATGTLDLATSTPPLTPSLNFDGDSAFQFLVTQTDMGPRWPGSPGHSQVRDYIDNTLTELGWSIERQMFDYQGFAAMNIIAKANEGQGDIIIIGAHYDTRRVADQTPGAAETELPVIGAVDGASGVAVLLELARTLDLNQVPREIWLAFFDVEDNGDEGLPGWDWIAGSKYMAANLTVQPEAAVIVDMIGDADQQLYYEGNSHQALQATLWQIAGDLGYGDVFVPQLKYTIIDDHLPFAWQGIAAVDIIDFDYAYWHTVEDTADKASPLSLLRVGHTLEFWLEEYLGSE